jgi:hypothetical protein
MTQVLKIRHVQTLDLADTGQMQEDRNVEVSLRYSALTSGWLARFSGSREGRTALPVLLALALHARPLTGEDFEKLKALELISEQDVGRLYCRITDVGLAEELNVHRTTIPKVMEWLVAQCLLRIIALPPEFSDSRGQFNGVRAYLLVGDGVVSSRRPVTPEGADASPEATREPPAVVLEPPGCSDAVIAQQTTGSSEPSRVQQSGSVQPAQPVGTVMVEPTPVSVQPSQPDDTVMAQVTSVSPEPTPLPDPVGSTVPAQPTDRVGSPDTKKTLPEERERGERRDVRAGLNSPGSESAERLAVAWGAAVRGAAVRGAVAENVDAAKILTSADLAALSSLVGQPEAGKLPLDALCALVPVWQRSAPLTVPGAIAAATQPVFAQALRLYAQEIGPVTALTAVELWSLAQRHPDPARWDAAFRKAVGLPDSLRRWRYVQAILEDRNGTHSAARHGSCPAQSRDTAPTGRSGYRSGSGRRPQGVWTPEEIERINAEAAARLAARGISFSETGVADEQPL